jgi:hypothetical protein
MLTLTGLLSAVLLLASMSGCGNRTVFVPEDSPMRVGEMGGVRMRVYHRINGEWVLSNNRITIPEGWYMVPPSYLKEE